MVFDGASRSSAPEQAIREGEHVCREKVGSLCSALENEESCTGAVEAIHALIGTVLLEPDGEQLKIALKANWREC